MNYRHGFHAGNFADVLKHAVLARILVHLRRKEGAFRVIDTHAGSGLYALGADQASRTGEWLDGIGRLAGAPLPPAAAELLAPYLGAVMADFRGERPAYPGSPLITRRLLRRQDRLTAIELHETEAGRLRTLFAGDVQVRVIHLDGWLALGAHVPPKERRGLVLIDPPFEQRDEFARMTDGLARAHRRWPGGTYALWYPVKDRAAVRRYREMVSQAGIADIIDVELLVRETGGDRLDGCAMTIINPPYTLEGELAVLLPELARILAVEPGSGRWRLSRLARES